MSTLDTIERRRRIAEAIADRLTARAITIDAAKSLRRQELVETIHEVLAQLGVE